MLIALKLAGWIDKASWSIVLIPVWLFHATVYGSLATLIYITRKQEDPVEEYQNSPISFNSIAIVYFPLVCFTISLVLKLDGIWSVDWLEAAVPYYLFEGVMLVRRVMDIHRIALIWPLGDPVLPLVKGALLYKVYRQLRWTILRIWLVSMVFFNLDFGFPRIIWSLAFIPAYIGLIFAPILDIAFFRAYKFAAMESRNISQVPNKHLVLLNFGSYISLLIVILGFLILLNLKVQFFPNLSWLVVFSPLIGISTIIALIIVAMIPVVLCCFCKQRPSLYDEELSSVHLPLRFGFGLAPVQPRITV